MEYNWSDPRKNSRLNVMMMSKAEALRKKRLGSVKSTVSNQLHPAIEKKLAVKKKKTPDTGRRPQYEDHSSPNNNHDEEEQEVRATFSPLQHETIPFEDFGLNAAADGLFHPASIIQAFTEHDAKYQIPETTATKEYPPSRENQRLPVLQSQKSSKQRERLSSRSESKLKKEELSALSSTRSDSDLLYAPRKSGVVPSTFDATALDFYEEEDDEEAENDEERKATSPRVIKTCPSTSTTNVPALDFSLTAKFEELKQMLKSNREKKETERVERPEALETNPVEAKAPSEAKVAQPKSTIAEKKLKAPAKAEEKAVKKQTLAAKATEKSTTAVPIRSKKEIKVRNGVSLSDLRQEHRAALEMLQELGGPVDVDYESNETNGKTAKSRAMATSKKTTVAKRTSVVSGPSLVTKLRSSVPSGREKQQQHDAKPTQPETLSPVARAEEAKDHEDIVWTRYQEDHEEEEEEEDTYQSSRYGEDDFDSDS